jgi:hypothetical protein
LISTWTDEKNKITCYKFVENDSDLFHGLLKIKGLVGSSRTEKEKEKEKEKKRLLKQRLPSYKATTAHVHPSRRGSSGTNLLPFFIFRA